MRPKTLKTGNQAELVQGRILAGYIRLTVIYNITECVVNGGNQLYCMHFTWSDKLIRLCYTCQCFLYSVFTTPILTTGNAVRCQVVSRKFSLYQFFSFPAAKSKLSFMVSVSQLYWWRKRLCVSQCVFLVVTNFTALVIRLKTLMHVL